MTDRRSSGAARAPEIDLGRCNQCQGCGELCPDVFSLHAAGYMQVAELDEYPRACIEEAMAKCPRKCIAWIGPDGRKIVG